MSANAEAEEDFAHQAFKIRRSEVFMEKREEAGTTGKTMKQLDVESDIDPRVQAAAGADREAKRRANYAKAAMDSVKAKLNCLISLSAKRRAEINAIDPHLRTHPAGHPSRDTYSRPPSGKS